jgi:hypothetical protein
MHSRTIPDAKVFFEFNSLFEDQNSSSSQKIINLASCSKPIILRAFVEWFVSTHDELETCFFRVDQNFITEMKMRGAITRCFTHKNYTGFQKIFPTLESYMHQSNLEFEFDLPFEEICYAALKLSSNRAMESVYQKIRLELSSIENFANLPIIKNLYPKFEFHLGDDKYWQQTGANTCEINAFCSYFHSLICEIKDVSNLSNPKSDLIRCIGNALLNNDQYFDTSISHFISKFTDVEIYEKPGILFPVCWGDKLATQGFPPHLVMCNLLSIVKSNTINTYINFLSITIDLPRGFDSEGFPNLGEQKYMHYINRIKLLYWWKFTSVNLAILSRHGIKISYLRLVKKFLSNFLKLILLVIAG